MIVACPPINCVPLLMTWLRTCGGGSGGMSNCPDDPIECKNWVFSTLPSVELIGTTGGTKTDLSVLFITELTGGIVSIVLIVWNVF